MHGSGPVHAFPGSMRSTFLLLLIGLAASLDAQSGGITEHVERGGFVLAPNPAQGEVTIVPTVKDLHMYVLFYDSEGRNVLSADLRATTRIDLSGLPNGYYMVSTVNDRGTPLDVHRLLVEH